MLLGIRWQGKNYARGKFEPVQRDHNGGSDMTKKLPPLHPGAVLREEFLVPLKLATTDAYGDVRVSK